MHTLINEKFPRTSYETDVLRLMLSLDSFNRETINSIEFEKYNFDEEIIELMFRDHFEEIDESALVDLLLAHIINKPELFKKVLVPDSEFSKFIQYRLSFDLGFSEMSDECLEIFCDFYDKYLDEENKKYGNCMISYRTSDILELDCNNAIHERFIKILIKNYPFNFEFYTEAFDKKIKEYYFDYLNKYLNRKDEEFIKNNIATAIINIDAKMLRDKRIKSIINKFMSFPCSSDCFTFNEIYRTKKPKLSNKQVKSIIEENRLLSFLNLETPNNFNDKYISAVVNPFREITHALSYRHFRKYLKDVLKNDEYKNKILELINAEESESVFCSFDSGSEISKYFKNALKKKDFEYAENLLVTFPKLVRQFDFKNVPPVVSKIMKKYFRNHSFFLMFINEEDLVDDTLD